MKTRMAALIAALMISTGAQAQTFFNNTTGLAAPATTVTFSEVALADDASVTNEFASFGVTLNNGIYNPQDGFLPRDYVGNFTLGGISYPDLQISFARTSGIAFELVTNTGTTVFNLFDGAALVGTANFVTGPGAGQYYGFTGGLFDRVQVVSADTYLLVDNVQLGTAGVPEPATWALMILGFGAVGGAMRRRQSMKATVRFA